MVSTTHRHVALLSVHPRYAYAILDGVKRVEFRKSEFKRDVSHVVIYATAPIGRVVGVFEVDGIDKQTPEDLWKSYHDVGGIEERSFFDYYSGHLHGVALKVGAVRRLTEPLSLGALRPGMTPPQSYLYLDGSCMPLLNSACEDVVTA